MAITKELHIHKELTEKDFQDILVSKNNLHRVYRLSSDKTLIDYAFIRCVVPRRKGMR